jgi:hypothetical protein
MSHTPSAEDGQFQSRFESCVLPPAEFDHRGHLRLAYVYLCDHDVDGAHALMRGALSRFLHHHGVDPTKYHETMTRAWLLAVRHFMELCPESNSGDAFMESDPRMLDSEIMMTHYSAELLFSDEARKQFVEPDISPIPDHER